MRFTQSSEITSSGSNITSGPSFDLLLSFILVGDSSQRKIREAKKRYKEYDPSVLLED